MGQFVQCPGCDKQYPLKPELIGKKVQCTGCGTTFPIKAPATAKSAGPEAAPASAGRSVQCTGCGKQYPLKPELIGKKVQCTGCGTTFAIKEPSAAKPAGPKKAAAGAGRSVRCTGCGKQYPLKPELAGKKVQCTGCGTTFAIPAGTGAKPPAPAPAPASGMGDLFDEEFDAGAAPTAGTAEAGSPGSGGLDNLFAEEFGSAAATDAQAGGVSASLPPAGPAPGTAATLGTLPRKKKKMSEEDQGLMRLGIGVAVFGAVAMLLPMIGLQFKILSFPGAESVIPIVALLVGAGASGMIWYSLRHNHAVGAGSAAGTMACIVVVYFATSAMGPGGSGLALLGGNPGLDSVTEDLIDASNELADCLSKVHDGDSARAAASRVDKLSDRYAELMRNARDASQNMTAEEQERFKNEYRQQVEDCSVRMGMEVARVLRNSDAADVLKGPLSKMLEAVGMRPPSGGISSRPPKRPPTMLGSKPPRNPSATPPRSPSATPPRSPHSPPRIPTPTMPRSHDDQRQKMIDEHGADRVVTVEITNLPEGGLEYVGTLLAKITPKSGRYTSGSGSRCTVTLGPVEGGARALSGKIDFGTVSNVDATAGRFAVAADRSKFPPPPGAQVTSPNDPNFYKQNLADLKGPFKRRQHDALKHLKDAEPKELKKEIAAAMVEVAKGDDFFTREDALEALCKWGGAENVDGLTPLMKDKNASIVKAAAKALAATKDPRAAAAIATRMGEHLRVEEHLLTMGPVAEDAVLANIDPANPEKCQEACRILLAIGTDKSAPKLKELAGHENRRVTMAAQSALRRIESGMAAPGTPSSEVAAVTNPNDPNFYKQNLADLNHFDDGRRSEAIKRLQNADPKELQKEIAAALLAMARGGDRFVRSQAAQALAVWAGPETVPDLIELLGDESTFVVRDVMKALAKTGDPRAAQALAAMLGQRMGVDDHLIAMGPMAEDAVLPLLNSRNDKIVAEACEVLGKIGTKKSVSKLRRLARSSNIRIRMSAERAARELAQGKPITDPGDTAGPAAGRDPIDALLLELQLNTSTARRAAAKLAGMEVDEKRRDDVSAALIKVLSSTGRSVHAGTMVSDSAKQAALGALAVWITPEDLPLMAKFLDHRTVSVRWAAYDALAKVNTEAAAQLLAKKIVGSDGRVIKSLTSMGPIGEKVLIEYLDNPAMAYRMAACSVLNMIGTEKSIPKLEELANATDPHLSKAAAGAIESIKERQK